MPILLQARVTVGRDESRYAILDSLSELSRENPTHKLEGIPESLCSGRIVARRCFDICLFFPLAERLDSSPARHYLV
jgi:hypothetical protein